MKRMWIGVGLLVAVLVTAIWSGARMERIHLAAALDLRQAAALAAEENWEQALGLTDRADQLWKQASLITAAFSEHESMENIESQFAQLEYYAAARDSVAFSSTCAYLSRQLEALGRCHSLTLPNLL